MKINVQLDANREHSPVEITKTKTKTVTIDKPKSDVKKKDDLPLQAPKAPPIWLIVLFVYAVLILLAGVDQHQTPVPPSKCHIHRPDCW
jgi:hypothetical protein